jgi:N-acetyl-anhydromuramyl-L-alanine amidase AmpD
MATATRRFIQARNYTRGRDSSIDVLVIHTMENGEKPDGAENIANWFAGSTAPRASAHYCIDNNSIVQCVRDEDVAWHAPGANHDGIGFEHAGTAKQTGRDWSDEYSATMLELSAELVAEKCVQYKIPPVWLTPADLQAGRRGITSHNNVSQAFHQSTHWDPGSGFNIQRYLKRVRELMGNVDPKAFKEDPPVVRQGDSGWRVKQLQKRLKLHGFDPGAVDGDFGPNTEKQVRAFQQAQDIEVDGIVGPMTWKMLNKAPQRLPA